MVNAQHRIFPGENQIGFWRTNRSPNLGQTTRPYINKKRKKETCKIVDFAVPVDHRVKLKENEKKNKYLDLARDFTKTVKHESNVYINYFWWSWYSHRRIIKVTGGLGNKRRSGDHSNYTIIEIGQNTEKSPGDLRWFAVTQNSVKGHQLTLMWKTLKE